MKVALLAAAAALALPAAARAQHQGHDMSGMAGMAHPAPADRGMAMTGALGPYPMSRDASGTAWQPDTSRHDGIHITAGDWMLMAHADLNLVYDWQQGPRGDERGFVSGMVMGMARREAGPGTLQLRAMLSPVRATRSCGMTRARSRRSASAVDRSGESAIDSTPSS